MYVNLSAFVDNLYYMGVGMLGVFAVVGVIIVATMLLLKFGGKEKA
ncbi:MAG: hypothetical protein Q4E65_07285 [Clostridia bacterium]|nr:hypothetical protein [Clostridia bacterium]